MIDEVMPEVSKRKLAQFCDVFCEKGVFTVEQSRKVLLAAKSLGMKLKIHADELSSTGGAELAAEVGAVSAEHLAKPSDDGIMAMARKDVIGGLLPATPYSSMSRGLRRRQKADRPRSARGPRDGPQPQLLERVDAVHHEPRVPQDAHDPRGGCHGGHDERGSGRRHGEARGFDWSGARRPT